jgi:hypothetical protein
MSAHLAMKEFMLNYLLWHQHKEVQHAVADKSDGNNDVDRMDDMVDVIGRGYDLKSEDPPVTSTPLKRTVSPNQDHYGVPLPK